MDGKTPPAGTGRRGFFCRRSWNLWRWPALSPQRKPLAPCFCRCSPPSPFAARSSNSKPLLVRALGAFSLGRAWLAWHRRSPAQRQPLADARRLPAPIGERQPSRPAESRRQGVNRPGLARAGPGLFSDLAHNIRHAAIPAIDYRQPRPRVRYRALDTTSRIMRIKGAGCELRIRRQLQAGAKPLAERRRNLARGFYVFDLSAVQKPQAPISSFDLARLFITRRGIFLLPKERAKFRGRWRFC